MVRSLCIGVPYAGFVWFFHFLKFIYLILFIISRQQILRNFGILAIQCVCVCGEVANEKCLATIRECGVCSFLFFLILYLYAVILHIINR